VIAELAELFPNKVVFANFEILNSFDHFYFGHNFVSLNFKKTLQHFA